MAKWSYKRPVHSGNDNAGCIWSLFRMLDFRQGSPRKLLSERKHGSARQSDDSLRSTIRLLSNSEEKHDYAGCVDDKLAANVDLGISSVKALVEKKMSSEQPLATISRSNIPARKTEKNSKKTSKKVASDFYKNKWKTSATSEDQLERSCILDLASALIDFYDDNHQCHETLANNKIKSVSFHAPNNIGNRQFNRLSELKVLLARQETILQEALVAVNKAIITENAYSTNQLAGKEGPYDYREFMAALDMLHSNNEFFLKLLDSSSSGVSKHVEDRLNAEDNKVCILESHRDSGAKEFIEETNIPGQYNEPDGVELFCRQYNALRKDDESKETKTSKGSDSCQGLHSIVVLRPILACNLHNKSTFGRDSFPQSHCRLEHQEDATVVQNFSWKGIKRRFRLADGGRRKAKNLISLRGAAYGIPYRSQQSGDTSKTSCRRACQMSGSKVCDKKPNRNGKKPKMQSKFAPHKVGSWKSNRKAILYKVAEKYLAEMRNTGVDSEIAPNSQALETLTELEMLPPQISPVYQLKEEHGTNQLNLMEQTLDGSSCNTSNSIHERQMFGEDHVLLDKQLQDESCCSYELNVKGFAGSMEVLEKANLMIEEGDEYSGVSLKFSTNRPDDAKERCEEEGSAMLGSLEVVQPSSPSVPVLPSSLPIRIELPNRVTEKAELQSPVSVLEPLFSDVIISPRKTEDTHVPSQQIQIEEHESCSAFLPLDNLISEGLQGNLIYIRKFLEASGLTCDKIPEEGHLSGWFLNPSLFPDAESSFCQVSHEPKLLSDCANQVLMEIQDRLFGCSPWISIIKRDVQPIPKGRNFIEEVCKGVGSYLHPHSESTINELVRKDMDAGSWTKLRIETESTVIEIGDLILAHLMEETVCEIMV